MESHTGESQCNPGTSVLQMWLPNTLARAQGKFHMFGCSLLFFWKETVKLYICIH